MNTIIQFTPAQLVAFITAIGGAICLQAKAEKSLMVIVLNVIATIFAKRL